MTFLIGNLNTCLRFSKTILPEEEQPFQPSGFKEGELQSNKAIYRVRNILIGTGCAGTGITAFSFVAPNFDIPFWLIGGGVGVLSLIACIGGCYVWYAAYRVEKDKSMLSKKQIEELRQTKAEADEQVEEMKEAVAENTKTEQDLQSTCEKLSTQTVPALESVSIELGQNVQTFESNTVAFQNLLQNSNSKSEQQVSTSAKDLARKKQVDEILEKTAKIVMNNRKDLIDF